jgi:DNA end-binding protein Ku
MRLECPVHGIVPREETVKGYEIAKNEYRALRARRAQGARTGVLLDARHRLVRARRRDRPDLFRRHYYLGAGKNGECGYRVLAQALQRTHRIAVGTFTWRGQTTPIAIRVHQDGLLLQRLYFADEVYNATEIDQGADPKIRDQERTLAERLISELSETEFHPEKYEDEYRKRLLKAIEQKITGQEIQRVEVETRPPTTDLVETLQASLGRKELAKVSPGKLKREPVSEKRPVRRKRAS